MLNVWKRSKRFDYSTLARNIKAAVRWEIPKTRLTIHQHGQLSKPEQQQSGSGGHRFSFGRGCHPPAHRPVSTCHRQRPRPRHPLRRHANDHYFVIPTTYSTLLAAARRKDPFYLFCDTLSFRFAVLVAWTNNAAAHHRRDAELVHLQWQ